MKKLIVIPARYASTRYPGKPLVKLRGANGKAKSLIQRSWEAANSVDDIDVVVATDHSDIKLEAEKFGANVIMTSSEHKNGTERCSEVAKKLPEYDLIINLQGDAPLTPSWFVKELIDGVESKNYDVATPVLKCDLNALNSFLEDRKNGLVGGTTVVFTNDMNALYFSKEVLPYTGGKVTIEQDVPVYHHVGVYAYKAEALQRYGQLSEGRWEKWEGLEQLRFLENNINIGCVEVNGRGRHFWELNNPEDVSRIEKVLKDHNIN